MKWEDMIKHPPVKAAVKQLLDSMKTLDGLRGTLLEEPWQTPGFTGRIAVLILEYQLSNEAILNLHHHTSHFSSLYWPIPRKDHEVLTKMRKLNQATIANLTTMYKSIKHHQAQTQTQEVHHG